MNRPGRRPALGGSGMRGIGGPSQSRGFARVAVMALIVVAMLAGGWFAVTQFFGGGCDEGYCATSLDVDPPQGFAFASDVYEYRGDAPRIPEGSSIEIDIPIAEGSEASTGLSFYRFLPDEGAWDHITTAEFDETGERAIGVFEEVPATIVLMQRDTPAGHAAAFLNPGDTLHPQARDDLTMVHTRDLTPTGGGGVSGEVSNVELRADQEHFPVLMANEEIEGAIANLDAILESSSSRTSHVQQIVEFVSDAGVDGVNLAFVDLRDDQRTSYALLVEELGTELDRAGLRLAVTLPPPERTQEGIDPGPYDWDVIGQAADLVVMQPILDQSSYRSEMPHILEYLSEQMPLNKLLLSITPYAVEKGEEVRRLQLVEAMRIATQIEVEDGKPATNDNVALIARNLDQTEGLSGMLWDESTATVAFTYRDDGGRTVWLENQYSAGFKLEFVTAYNLGGFAVDDASDDEMHGNLWPALVDFIQTGEPDLARPDSDTLSPQWEVTGGSIEGGQRGVARWTTPSEPGTYTVELRVSDGVFTFQSQTEVTVEQREEPDDADDAEGE